MEKLTKEYIETFAQTIFENYLARQKERQPEEIIEYPTWESLPSSLKDSNRRQAAAIPDKLSVINCYLDSGYKDAVTSNEVDSFTDEEIEAISEYEHEIWVEERRAGGWKLGAEKDIENKISPYLIPYDQLADEIKELDRDAVANILPLVTEVGLRVFRRIPNNDC